MKRILLLMTVALTFASLSAQEKFKPYGYLQLQGGVGTTFTNVCQNKILSPTFTVGVGVRAISQVGLRLNLNGWQSKGGFASIPDKYKFNYFNADVDIIFHPIDLFTKRWDRFFDVGIIAGFGINHAWNNNISSLPLTAVKEDISNIWGNDLQQTSYNGTSFRMGMMFDFRLSHHWLIGLEADINAMGDDWNAKYQKEKRDWMLTTQLSLTYRFGFSKKKATTPSKPQEVAEPRPQATGSIPVRPVTTPEPKNIKTPEPQNVKTLNEVLQYRINETEATATIVIDKVVAWIKNNPKGKISIEGYADKGTGTPAINMKYAQQRADKVAAALRAKGVPADKITVTVYGDTKQPFADNDQNRCVIIIGG
ncbi:MAG: OmpA family protein [Bacteroidaceae bacterium]|nr:OmpA family protein [Bacteroidaceae bacterium]